MVAVAQPVVVPTVVEATQGGVLIAVISAFVVEAPMATGAVATVALTALAVVEQPEVGVQTAVVATQGGVLIAAILEVVIEEPRPTVAVVRVEPGVSPMPGGLWITARLPLLGVATRHQPGPRVLALVVFHYLTGRVDKVRLLLTLAAQNRWRMTIPRNRPLRKIETSLRTKALMGNSRETRNAKEKIFLLGWSVRSVPKATTPVSAICSGAPSRRLLIAPRHRMGLVSFRFRRLGPTTLSISLSQRCQL